MYRMQPWSSNIYVVGILLSRLTSTLRSYGADSSPYPLQQLADRRIVMPIFLGYLADTHLLLNLLEY